MGKDAPKMPRYLKDIRTKAQLSTFLRNWKPGQATVPKVVKTLLSEIEGRGLNGLKRKRVAAIIRTLPGIIHSFIIQFGNLYLRSGNFNSVARISKVVYFLHTVIHQGMSPVKNMATNLREQAMKHPSKSKERFQASTIDRAIPIEVQTKDTIANAKESFLQPARTLDDFTRKKIDKFFVDLKISKAVVLTQDVALNDHACVTKTRKQGGMAAALREQYFGSIDYLSMLSVDVSTPTRLAEFLIRYSMGRENWIDRYTSKDAARFGLSNEPHFPGGEDTPLIGTVIFKWKVMARSKFGKRVYQVDSKHSVASDIIPDGDDFAPDAGFSPKTDRAVFNYCRGLIMRAHRFWIEEKANEPLDEKMKRFEEESGGIPTKVYIRSGLNTTLTRSVNADLKIIAVTDLGKARAVTLHPADEVLSARTLTAKWMPKISRCHDMQNAVGRPTALRSRDKSAKLFSLDLSKATDKTHHDVAKYFAHKWIDKIGSSNPEEDKKLVDRLFSPKSILETDGTRTATTCGVHMGLGPTWVILCLMNMYAAWRANLGPSTRQICGDDMAVLANTNQRDKIKSALEDELFLKVNEKKSFFGPRGVFCETFGKVERTKFGVSARFEDVGHMSVSLATRSVTDTKTQSFNVARTLDGSTAIGRVDEITRKLHVPKKLGSGPIEMGGNGRGIASLNQIINYAMHGPIKPMRKKESERYLEERKVPFKECIPAEWAKQWLDRCKNELCALTGDTKEKKISAYIQTRSAIKRTAPPPFPGLTKSIVHTHRYAQLSLKLRRTVDKIIRESSRFSPSSSTRKKLTKLLLTKCENRFVDAHCLLEAVECVGLSPLTTQQAIARYDMLKKDGVAS
nr:MAG: RNA-dependent RNA polymerase [Narnaviridae sp.]